MDPNTKLLSKYDAYPEILVAGHQHGVGHRLIAGQFGHIRYNQGINALLFANRVNLPQPSLDVRKIGESHLPCCRTAKKNGVVPVDTEERKSGQPSRCVTKGANDGRDIEREIFSYLLRAGQQNRPLNKEISSVNEYRCALHDGTP